jgi:hypothetical protein
MWRRCYLSEVEENGGHVNTALLRSPTTSARHCGRSNVILEHAGMESVRSLTARRAGGRGVGPADLTGRAAVRHHIHVVENRGGRRGPAASGRGTA